MKDITNFENFDELIASDALVCGVNDNIRFELLPVHIINEQVIYKLFYARLYKNELVRIDMGDGTFEELKKVLSEYQELINMLDSFNADDSDNFLTRLLLQLLINSL